MRSSWSVEPHSRLFGRRGQGLPHFWRYWCIVRRERCRSSRQENLVEETVGGVPLYLKKTKSQSLAGDNIVSEEEGVSAIFYTL